MRGAHVSGSFHVSSWSNSAISKEFLYLYVPMLTSAHPRSECWHMALGEPTPLAEERLDGDPGPLKVVRRRGTFALPATRFSTSRAHSPKARPLYNLRKICLFIKHGESSLGKNTCR